MMIDVAGRLRDVFPLPFLSAPFADHCMHNSRSARKKLSQKVHDVGRTNEAISALNDLCMDVLCRSLLFFSSLASSQLRSTFSEQLPGVWRLRPFSKSRPRKPFLRFSDHPPWMAMEVP